MIAEKFEAMVKLGELNSRMKDFHDIWLLSRQYDFKGIVLWEAIKLTFDQRGTDLSDEIIAFKNSFADHKQVQWTAFRKRLNHDQIPESFQDVITQVKKFLLPIVVSSQNVKTWIAPGPWKNTLL